MNRGNIFIGKDENKKKTSVVNEGRLESYIESRRKEVEKGRAKALRTSRRRQEPCERVSVRGAIGREGPLSGKGGWVLSNAK